MMSFPNSPKGLSPRGYELKDEMKSRRLSRGINREVEPTHHYQIGGGWPPPYSPLVWQRTSNIFFPTCQDDVFVHSDILTKIQSSPKRFAQRIFQGIPVQESGGLLTCGPWTIITKGNEYKSGTLIPTNGFFNDETGVYGYNLIELLAHYQHIEYDKAIAIAAKNLKVDERASDQEDQKSWYRHERNPVSIPPRPQWSLGYTFGCTLLAEFAYARIEGHPYMYTSRWRLPNGKSVTLYMSLVSHYRSQTLSWCEIAPQKPYPLFNEFRLNAEGSLNVPIVVCDSEFEAATVNLSRIFSLYQATSCFGGFDKLPVTDIVELNGRDIYIYCNSKTMARVVRALRQLKGGNSFHVILNGISRNGEALPKGQCSILPANEFLSNLAQFEAVSEDEISGASTNGSLITPPGGRIPGADIKRKMLISPIIREGEIVWLYGKEKAGKSWFGIAFSYMAAKGHCTAGKWVTDHPARVLYVDGEMLPDDLNNNIDMVMRGFGDFSGEIPFSQLAAKSFPGGTISILEEEWRSVIEEYSDGIDLVIFDNFYSLTDNKVTDIKPVGEFIQKLSQKGIAVIMLDHTNTEGELQGSISKRRLASLAIEIKDAGENQLTVSYPVARRLHGENEKAHTIRKVFSDNSFLIELVEDVEIELSISDRLCQMAQIKYMREHRGLSFTKIADGLGIKRSTAHQQYSEQISKLPVAELEQLEREVARLVSQHVV